MIEQSEAQTGKKKSRKSEGRHRKSEKEEDEELLKEEDDEPFAFTETPACQSTLHSIFALLTHIQSYKIVRCVIIKYRV